MIMNPKKKKKKRPSTKKNGYANGYATEDVSVSSFICLYQALFN